MLSQLQLLQQLQGPQVLDYLPLLLVKDKMSLNHQMNKLYLSTAKAIQIPKRLSKESFAACDFVAASSQRHVVISSNLQHQCST